jgi:hypothetical protein
MNVHAFPPHIMVDGDPAPRTRAADDVPPAPFWDVTDSQAAFMHSERRKSRGVILILALVLAAQLGFVTGVSTALGIQQGWW